MLTVIILTSCRSAVDRQITAGNMEIVMHPNDPASYNERGSAYLTGGQFEEALALGLVVVGSPTVRDWVTEVIDRIARNN